MTLEQLNLIKDSYMKESTRPDGRTSTLGEYIKLCLDGNIDFVTSKDCVVFDDANELLHCVCINENLQTQSDFPVKVISSNYAVVQQMETIMSQKNFEEFLDNGFIASLISEDKKKFITNYTRSIKNHALQPMDAEPYYTQNPTVIPMPAGRIKRVDGITSASAPATANFAPDYDKIIEEAIKTSGTVKLERDVMLTKGIELASGESLTIDLNGSSLIMPIDSDPDKYAIDITGDGNMIISDSGSGGGAIYFAGKYAIGLNEGSNGNLTIEGGKFCGGANTESIVDVVEGNLIVNGGVFESANTGIRTFTEAAAEPAVMTRAAFMAPICSAIINGGTFECYESLDGDNITVFGGTFINDCIDDSHIAEGYELVQTKDENDVDYYTVTKIVPLASVDGVNYINLQDAVTAALNTDNVVTLLRDVTEGVGVIVPAETSVTIDLAGYEYAVSYPVGSPGTETNCMQLLKNANVTIKNGTINKNYGGNGIIIQNYSNLILDDVTLKDDTGIVPYVLSNNNGNITLKNNTNIIAPEGKVAFDAYYWPSHSSGFGAISITTDNLTGLIDGAIEVAHDNSVDDEAMNENITININSGRFTTLLDTTWIENGYEIVYDGDGIYTVEKIPAVATVDGVEYSDLQEAVTAALDTGNDVVLARSVESNGVGVIVPKNATVVIDLNGYEYTFDGAVGSTGTETNGLQLLKDANVTIKNGTMYKGFDGDGILIQNYSNLTLDNVTLEADGASYVVSNNNGGLTLKNNTNITADAGKVAFDAYYWPSNGNKYGPITITTDNLTGKVIGNIEVTHDSSVDDEAMNENVTINIDSGTFTMQLNENWIADGCVVNTNDDGTYTVTTAS